MIETGKIYDCFDDGKITRSRHYLVYIIRERRVEDLPAELKEVLLRVSEDSSRLFDSSPKSVLEGVSYEQDVAQVVYFLPTGKDRWFGAGLIYYDYETGRYERDIDWCSGRLDVDGSLTKTAFG